MLTLREADKTDLPKIVELISTVWQADGPKCEMHIGDLSWSLFNSQTAFESRRPRIWLEDDNLVAFSMSSPNHWIDLVIQPGFDPTVILPTAIESAAKFCRDQRVRIGRRLEEQAIVSWLTSAGYERMKFGYPTLEHTLERLDPADTLAGFSVKSLAESSTTPAAQAKAWNAAFPDERRVTEDIASLSFAPGYRADLDFICIDGTGEIGAFCTIWYDAETKSGLFEPVGTAANFQRQGLATAIVKHALLRLKEIGASKAYVRVHSENEAAMSFYRSVGFRQAESSFGFEQVK